MYYKSGTILKKTLFLGNMFRFSKSSKWINLEQRLARRVFMARECLRVFQLRSWLKLN